MMGRDMWERCGLLVPRCLRGNAIRQAALRMNQFTIWPGVAWRRPRWPMLASMILVAVASTPATLTAAQAQAAEDGTEVVGMVEAYERAWNTHDASALSVFFAEDADMLFGNGPMVRGRQAIQEWWALYFARLDEGRGGTFTIDSIRLIAPGVALVNIESWTGGRSSNGQELPTRLARGTWVLVRQGEGWLISALRGLPAEGDVRTGPGRDR